MADLFFLHGEQFFDADGDPLAGGKLRFYDAGTSSPRTVYQDSDVAVPWSQPVTLDSAGRLTASVYISEGAFKATLHTSAEVLVWTEDDIPGAPEASTAEFARPQRPVITRAANAALTTDELGALVVADATGGSFTLSLPSAAGVASGKGYDVLVVGTNGSVTIDGNGSETINGATTLLVRAQYGSVSLVSDGANWQALAARIPATTPASKTSGFTVTMADEGRLFLCDATSAGFTVTLPSVATAGNGFRVGVKKTDASANAVTLDGNSSETIDGATTLAMARQHDTVWLRCDGAAWQVEAYVGRSVVAAAATSQSFELHGVILGLLGNRDYRLMINVQSGFTITRTTTRSVAGTGTATFKINTTALGGTANSVSTSEQEQAHALSNVAATGDDVVLTLSATSSLEDLSFSIWITRTLAG